MPVTYADPSRFAISAMCGRAAATDACGTSSLTNARAPGHAGAHVHADPLAWQTRRRGVTVIPSSRRRRMSTYAPAAAARTATTTATCVRVTCHAAGSVCTLYIS
jgi:hypothetical protein